MIKGTGTGVSTNIDGEFSIEAAAGEELIVSFIGYLTQTIKIDSQKTHNIKLLEDTKTLEEVVVVGYTVDYPKWRDRRVQCAFTTNTDFAGLARFAG